MAAHHSAHSSISCSLLIRSPPPGIRQVTCVTNFHSVLQRRISVQGYPKSLAQSCATRVGFTQPRACESDLFYQLCIALGRRETAIGYSLFPPTLQRCAPQIDPRAPKVGLLRGCLLTQRSSDPIEPVRMGGDVHTRREQEMRYTFPGKRDIAERKDKSKFHNLLQNLYVVRCMLVSPPKKRTRCSR